MFGHGDWSRLAERARFALLLLLVVLTVVSAPICPLVEHAYANDALDSYEYGLHLQERGEYYRAVSEFLRAEYLAGEGRVAELALFQVGRSYVFGGEYSEAVRELEGFLLRFPESPLAPRVRLLLARSELERSDFAAARERVAVLGGEEWMERREGRLAEEERGWSYLGEFELTTAGQHFRTASQAASSPTLPSDERLARLLVRLDDGAKLRRKSPALAGVLSGIVPGLGQVYIGRPGDGLAAFLVNGLFIWGAIAAYNKEMYEVAGVLGFIEIGWYGGNIVGAVSGAKRFNRNERRVFLDGLYRDFRLPPEDY